MHVLMFAVSVSVMLFQQWLETTPIQGSSREVVVADVRLFAVRDVATAKRMRELAANHKRRFDIEMQTYNSPAVYWRWEAECEWREQCWSELETAIDSDPPWFELWSTMLPGTHRVTYSRVKALERLRSLLGERAFWSGQMPSPTPNYRIHLSP